VTLEFDHKPVLLEESLSYMALTPGAIVVDGTLGGGGHTEAILERTSPSGRVVGLDLDQQALAATAGRLARFGDRLQCVQSSFRRLDEVVESLGIDAVDAVLLDLGVSSHQLDTPGRGFRFGVETTGDVPLDMRMNAESGEETAADVLRRASVDELHKLFERYGELPGSKRLARAIVETRLERPLETSADLLQVIDQAGIGRGRRHNPATLVFQALRIAVNDELDALEDGIAAALAVLKPAGRLVVISYHSLEDRIVKHRFRNEARACSCPPKQPICTCGGVAKVSVVTRRLVRPSDAEVAANPRARSARLRAAERLGEAA
jgi:16S rRNA (cytosine1402-N4)-methyltransferase